MHYRLQKLPTRSLSRLKRKYCTLSTYSAGPAHLYRVKQSRYYNSFNRPLSFSTSIKHALMSDQIQIHNDTFFRNFLLSLELILSVWESCWHILYTYIFHEIKPVSFCPKPTSLKNFGTITHFKARPRILKKCSQTSESHTVLLARRHYSCWLYRHPLLLTVSCKDLHENVKGSPRVTTSKVNWSPTHSV